jgi:hypothetical protein
VLRQMSGRAHELMRKRQRHAETAIR